MLFIKNVKNYNICKQEHIFSQKRFSFKSCST